ncbi:CDP-alcohol phosphatidyltransferase family protein [Aureimonas phyllosphaerae]|uniref:Phosphatidylglycerophosphate synthase n=1 Tax=Aureimonas phyllosphaerae TaxID=1166078 RepID=A0A7W6BRT8_9HYPH|nr:CDP-alcohol phosphatidyltransferase family protein [Aureimonas phyllosphaerae]MBB3935707.1 phosphatidylglycerophosphate synthase [Aureimonas phyllosphaerae]MBB3959715.1 phosphatidylglycerophosphate synthase [Aureimonas phyllosphaerae]SFF14121.1 Phosphatidylglycerophosphate synthase [Aureimonas phyllosphaerae]
MRFDPIPLPARAGARIPQTVAAHAPSLPGACTTLAGTALLLTVAASLLVSHGGLGWHVLPLSLVLFLPTAAFVVWRLDDHPHERFGPANIITTARGGMAAVIGACAWEYGRIAATDSALQWLLVASALFALALDGVDGFLARRSGLASRFGERFDMEVDAFLILILCVLALICGKAGVHVLAIGLMRYAFLAWAAIDARLTRPLAPSMRRKTVCVLQIALLCVALLPPVSSPWSDGLVLLALGLLTWSFAVDIRSLLRRPA